MTNLSQEIEEIKIKYDLLIAKLECQKMAEITKIKHKKLYEKLMLLPWAKALLGF